jgi:hypothetical protein
VAVAQLEGKRGPHHAASHEGGARRTAASHRHGERTNYPPNPSVNYLAAFIFTSTA